ncbi:MAG: very short patch repair endonuclease, partial [Candidatus Thiodiazotropha sp. (ex Lucinoma borealis)]|nr:very short patch repair endonuclease [Candidatus Thiodiazotropha sp. (ex Lucinoma borealis)]
TDTVDQATRSKMMSRIRGKDTSPELLLRQGLYRNGFRYRLHSAAIPGKPDIVLKKYRALMFVNGCFWHGHECHLFKWPKTRPEFWKSKILGNRERDARSLENCRNLGWRVLIVWECALKGKNRQAPEKVIELVSDWITGTQSYGEISGVLEVDANSSP